MANASPNNSVLTFSPLLVKKRTRDHFNTPPAHHNASTNTNINTNTIVNGISRPSHPTIQLPNSYLHQSSPQNNRRISSLIEEANISAESIDKHQTPSITPSETQFPNNPISNTGPGNTENITSLGNETTNGMGNNPNNLEASTIIDASHPLSQADKLRLWRHDALLQHHYKTAIYIGDKVLSLTNDPNDAFWLAQVHYASGNFQSARNLLAGPTYETSVGCIYLAGLCLYKLDKLDEALDIIGEVNPFKKDHSIRNPDGGIKLEASMCHLRGLIYTKQNNFERGKNCFREAVLVDVKCFEAFDALISNHLLTPDEEWELLDSLNFDDADNNSEFVKLLYTTHINKYKNLHIYEEARQRLNEEFELVDNIDIMLSQAELFFVKCKFQECLDLCTKIIDRDELNISALSNYLSCLYELGGKNKLFLMAHKLAENYPNHYITWVAIGIYYFSINQISEARAFFSKASILNPNFASAWIGFAHTFAADGEHEQAVSAYATAARLFPGTHLPNLFLGMQYLQMSNYTLAWEYLNFAYSICPTDPLLLNEIGVLNYHKNELQRAEIYLRRALVASKTLEYGSKAWCSIHCNLAHVYRRMGLFEKAIRHFNEVLKIAKNDVNIYSTLGLICLKMGKIGNAVEYLHIALAIQPNDAMATDLLDKALDLNVRMANRKYLNEALKDTTNTGRPSNQPFGEVLKGLRKIPEADSEREDVDDIMDIESE
jgi:anaphase-promoting complex subunit 6